MTDSPHSTSQGAATRTGPPAAALEARRRYGAVLQSALVVVAALALLWPRARERDFWWSDASRHGLDGVFLVDMVRDGGIVAPRAYTIRYAARYPALGVAYYPPLFAALEALAYGVAGVTYATARGVVVLFGALAGLGCYLLGRRLRGGWFGVVAAIGFLTMHDAVYWSRDVMLEMPAAALGIGAMVFSYLWVEEGRRWAVILCGVCLGAALMTKQTSAFLFAVPPAHALLRGRWRQLLTWRACAGFGLAAAVAVAYGAFLFMVYRHTLLFAVKGKGLAGAATGWGLPRLTYFFRVLPSVSSVPCVVLAAVGAAAGLWRRRWRELCLPGLWCAAAYAFATYACPGRSRFMFGVLPAVAIAGALGVWELLPARVGWVPARVIGATALVVYFGYSGLSVGVPWVSDGYRQAAGLVVAEPQGETVLFHGYHAGNFVYHVRVADRERAAIVLRSEKLFGRVHRLGHATEQFEPAVATAEEIAELLTAHGVGYVVIEPNGHSAASALDLLLRDAVSRPPWRLSAEVPVASHLAKPGEGEILVYENPEAGRATAEAIPFWVPLSERTLRVTYESLRRDRQGWGRP